MNWFDVHVLLFLNHFANRWLWLDSDIARVYSTTIIGGGTTMALAWWALFDPKEVGKLRKGYELLLGAMLLCGVATLAARALALALPFRARPMWTAALHFQIPHGEDLRLLGWSAFPSDHATLFFGLATGIFFISRPLGWVAFSWVTVVIAFPALYLGIHWPTDIIAGAFLGAAFVHIAKIPAVRNSIAPFAARSYHQYPGIFFAILFLWSYEVTNLFEDGRRLLRLLWHQIPH